jgi:hypothetical protein
MPIDADALITALNGAIREIKATVEQLPGTTRTKLTALSDQAKETVTNKLLSIVSKLNT